jgi:hypothetical protein
MRHWLGIDPFLFYLNPLNYQSQLTLKVAVFIFHTLPQMTGRRVGMPFILSPPTLALRFRQNNGPTPSGDYQPSRSLSVAGSDCRSFCCLLGLGCPKQAFAKIATPRFCAKLKRTQGVLGLIQFAPYVNDILPLIGGFLVFLKVILS